jgi:hypothetical protein
MDLHTARGGDYEIAKRYLGERQVVQAAKKMYDKARSKLETGDRGAAASIWYQTFAPEAPRDQETLDKALQILVEHSADSQVLWQIERALEESWPVPNLEAYAERLKLAIYDKIGRILGELKSHTLPNPERAVELVLLYEDIGLLDEELDTDLVERVNRAVAAS